MTPLTQRRGHRPENRSGQVALALIFMLMGLIFLTLVNVDVFLSVREKNRLENAGDAAALAAARWQGITLNMIGALNLAHVDMACRYADDPLTSVNLGLRINALQERLAFAGPMMAVYAAQRAALKNHAEPNDDMSALVNEIIARAATEVHGTELWPDKASDFTAMLRSVTVSGIAAGIDNASLMGAEQMEIQSGGSLLFNRSFYEAVRGEDWCWFWFLGGESVSLLQNFNGWSDVQGAEWSLAADDPVFYGTHVLRRRVRFLPRDGFEGVHPEADKILLEFSARQGATAVTPDALAASGILTNDQDHAWYFYDEREWGRWKEMDIGGANGLPLLSEVKDEYDVYGACTAARVIGLLDPLTPDVGKKQTLWTGAAKPFGCRETANGRCPVTKYGAGDDGAAFTFVTPDFRDVRLIPLAGVNEGRLNMADREWVVHTRDHVKDCADGMTFDGCRYCSALKKWNDAAFRAKGVMWLISNSETCRRPGGSGVEQGGTRHAH